jgi:hypothetical protein
MKRQALVCSLLIGLMALKFADAHATAVSVLTSDSEAVQQSGADMLTFSTPGAGEVFVTVTDLITAADAGFFAPFASLQYGLTDAEGLDTGMINAGVTTSLTVGGATTIDANVFDLLGGHPGLFNLTATFVPASLTVPLPASGVSIIGGGLMLLFGARRRRASL